MTEFALACSALLAFLLPISAYFLFLASVNRRGRPMMVSGAWDAIGLLFAGSGFFLITVPMLFSWYFFHINPSRDDPFNGDWLRNWTLWMIYFLALVCGGGMMVVSRSHKTIVYNVDGEHFSRILEHALAGLNLGVTRKNRKLVLAPALPTATPENTAIMASAPFGMETAASPDDRRAELSVDAFPLLCNVTLHWDRYSSEVREDVERELEKSLSIAAPLENPAAGWFLIVAGFMFGALVVFLFTVALLLVLGVR